METQFLRSDITCLHTALQEVRSAEETLEIRLPEGLPDVGRIVACWGQAILRGKEWRGDSISCSAGVMVWVLYAPEDGSTERVLEGWIPFQMKWNLPEGTPEGDIRVNCLLRFTDARSITARKILVRAGLSAMAEAFVPQSVPVFSPDKTPEKVELLKRTYPIRLQKEAGEKAFLLGEELSLPESAPKPERIISYRLNPRLTDRKLLSDKLVFRGNGNLHMLYRSEEGQLHGWDFELPFSQYAQLGDLYGGDAQADLVLSPTGLELEMGEEGRLRLKGGIAAQYRITDNQTLEIVEDAYSPDRELAMQRSDLELPVVLDTRRENLYGEQAIPAEANIAADVNFLPDFPRQLRTDNGVEMEVPGVFQVLYYGEDGMLRSGTARWEGHYRINADENSRIQAMPLTMEPQSAIGNGQILAKTELPLEMTATTRQTLPMVTGLELGQQRERDPGRPALILRRAGEEDLWDIAKTSGSTMEAIRRANKLQSDPSPGQMLLIPVM